MRIIRAFSFVFIFMACAYGSLLGQYEDTYSIIQKLESREKGYGKLDISMDEVLVDYIHHHIQYNSQNRAIPGYRIRIFSDSGFDSRERAEAARTRFIRQYEQVEAYLQHDDPDFKVYVGDCRSKSEALKILQMIKKDFPYAFIIPQNINLNKE
jgi:hypothetical protein